MEWGDIIKIINLSYSKNLEDIKKEGYEFIKEEYTDTELIYRFLDKKKNSIEICFRGVDAFKDMLYCFDCSFLDVGYYGKFHRGFFKKFLNVMLNLNSVVNIKKIKNFKVVGYSLGGAIAMLFVWYILYYYNINSKNVELYIVGSPRVGNIYFNKYLYELKVFKSYVYGNDFITHLPPKFLGYSDDVGKKIRIVDKNIFNFIRNHWDYNKVKYIKEDV